MPHSDDDLEARGWTADELRATVAAYRGVGADADLPDDVRFLVNVTRVIRRRLAGDGAATETGLALFCLFPFEPGARADEYEEEVPMLDDGTSAIGGRLWRVGPTAAKGIPLDIEGGSDAEAFERAISIGAGSAPAVVFKPAASTSELRFYPHGVARADEYRAIAFGGTAVSLDDVLAAVDHVHKNELVTPDAQTYPAHTWTQQHRPVTTAEKVVQHYLKVGLGSAFPWCRISVEQPGVAGRTDLEIEEVTSFESGAVTRHVLLELKVLRSHGATGTRVTESDTRKWIKEGVEQAAAYRAERGTLAAALCCFDMRQEVTGDTCFVPIAKLAGRVKVTLRCWHLFSTSKKYREHAAASGTGS